MKTAVIYARCSTEEQREKGLSIPSQLQSVREYCEKSDIEVLDEYIDEGFSGSLAQNRPDFQRMFTDIESGYHRPDYVVVWSFSRFARNALDSKVYKHRLSKHRITVLSVSEPLPEDEDVSTLLEGIYELFDEQYSRRIRKDTLRHMRQNAEKGYWNGGVPPFGFERSQVEVGGKSRSVLKVNEYEAIAVRKIFDLYAKGESLEGICRELNAMGVKTRRENPFQKTSLYSILTNPIYVGRQSWNRYAKVGRKFRPPDEWIEAQEGTHQVVSESLWNAVQAVVEERKAKNQRNTDNSYWLSGTLWCRCEQQMTGHRIHRKGEIVRYYHCRSCHHYVQADMLERLVSELISEQVHNMGIAKAIAEELIEITESLNEEAKGFQREILNVERQLLNLTKTIEDGLYSATVRSRIAELEQQKKTFEDEIRRAEQSEKKLLHTPKAIQKEIEELLVDFESDNLGARKRIARLLLKKVVVDKKRDVTVYFATTNVYRLDGAGGRT